MVTYIVYSNMRLCVQRTYDVSSPFDISGRTKNGGGDLIFPLRKRPFDAVPTGLLFKCHSRKGYARARFLMFIISREDEYICRSANN